MTYRPFTGHIVVKFRGGNLGPTLLHKMDFRISSIVGTLVVDTYKENPANRPIWRLSAKANKLGYYISEK